MAIILKPTNTQSREDNFAPPPSEGAGTVQICNRYKNGADYFCETYTRNEYVKMQMQKQKEYAVKIQSPEYIKKVNIANGIFALIIILC